MNEGISARHVFVDPSADIHSSVKIWHFSRVLANVHLAPNVQIGGGCEIGRGSDIGEGSRIGANSFLPPNSRIGKRVFIGPCVTMTDDRHPRVGNADYNAEPPVIGDDARIGAGVVILPGVVIGARAMVGAGSVVTSSVPAGAAVRGTPARAFDPPAEWVVQ